MRSLIAFIVVALIVFFIVTQPETAAALVKAIVATLVAFFNAIVTFFQELT